MAIKNKITSYDVPDWLKDKLNAMTYAEVVAYQKSVKPPAACYGGDPDLTIWWACAAVLEHNAPDDAPAAEPSNPFAGMSDAEIDRRLKIMEWVNSDEYDNE